MYPSCTLGDPVRNIILAIDDSPARYARLEALVEDVVVTQRPGLAWWMLDIQAEHMLGVCLDYDMPGRNGMWYCRTVLVHHPHMPIFITSANPVGGDAMEFFLRENGATVGRGFPIGDWHDDALAFFRAHWEG